MHEVRGRTRSRARGAAGPPRADELFLAALEQPRAEWSAFVERACGTNAALRDSVFSLLRAHEQTGPVDRLAEELPRVGTAVTEDQTSTDQTGSRPTPAPRFAPGATLGRYEIRERLGAGGMGEVFRARDTRLQREVAIKVISRRIEDRPEALGRFEEEARAASALNHPNIVTVHDIGEQGGFPYIVMELVEGRSLREEMDEPLPVERIVRLASQLAGALAAAHERGVVHRDLKPANVVVTPQGVAKILDFGVARFQPMGRELNTLPTLRGEGVVGTVGYMAPEALKGLAVDHRADQFALGAVLHEMATGRPCFRRSSAAETLVATLQYGPEPLARERPDLPAALVQLVEKCLSKDPADRYASTWSLHKAFVSLSSEAPRRPSRAAAGLPAAPNALIGRRDELHRIQNLVLEARVRLITITGPGGSGKTRLAIEAARSLEPSFPGGVVLVSLAALRDPELVDATIARALLAAEGGGADTGSRRELKALLVERVAESGAVLLVLDNFEQVVDAAPAIGELVAACPELCVVVTSREVLRLQAEHDFPLQPLPLPAADEREAVEDVARSPAVALFVERARTADPGFVLTQENAAAVAELCTRLDGLPLALELAAVRVRTLTPAAMLQRLASRLALATGGRRDLPGRQRTLRQAIDWSHELLSASEQLVFRRVAVFSGGFTLEAAEAAVDPFGRLDAELSETVGSLLDKSLLVKSSDASAEPRFGLLETVREYALERLGSGDEAAAVRKAHAAYFLVLAEEGEVVERGRRGVPWMERLARERDNFRSALDWAVEGDNAEWGVRIAQGLYHYWEHWGDAAEGHRRFEQLLALPSAQAPTTLRAKALWFAAGLSDRAGHGAAVDRHREGLRIYQELGDRRGEATTLMSLSIHLAHAGALGEARTCVETCLGLWRQLGDDGGYGRALSNLAFLHRQEGQLDRARQLYREAAATFARVGDRLAAAWEVSHEGDIAFAQGEKEATRALYASALDSFRELRDPWGIGSALSDLGDVARNANAPEAAGDLYRQALETYAALGHRRGVARALEALAVLEAGRGGSERTLVFAAAAAAHRTKTGSRTPDELSAPLTAAVEGARCELEAGTAAAAWRRGARLSLEETIRAAALASGRAQAP